MEAIVTTISLIICVILTIGIAILFFVNKKKNKKLNEELMAEKATLEAVIDVIPDFVFCKDLNHNYTRFNKRLLDYFSVSASDVMGKNDADGLRLPADTARMYYERDQKVLSEGQLSILEEYVPGTDGEMILCETIRVPMTRNGKVVGLVGISRDITHRNAMESTLKKTVEKAELEAATLNAIFDSIPDFIFCKDMNLKYTRCNKHMEDYFGVSEADLIGKDDAEGLGAPPEMVQACNASDIKILETGQLTISEEFVPGADGALVLCETIKVPIIQNGEIVGLTGVSRDVTERKAHEDAAQAASRAKGEFLSCMSHEMRTPMNAIIGMTAIGKMSTHIEKKDDAFRKIESASKHLLGVINDILDMSKIEAGKLELSSVNFEFEKLLQNVVNVINFRVEERRQQLYVSIDKHIPSVFTGDNQRLSQVIANLLSNAVKFTPEGGVIHLDSRLISSKDGAYRVQISVEDTGIGISDEQKKRLFQSFEQADADTTRKYGGTGLGLAIVKPIVELMGGEISVESELGKGSKFTFSVLLKRGTRDKTLMLDKSVVWENISVFAVDLEPEIREFFTAFSDNKSIDCAVAASGEEALEMLKQKKNYNFYFICRTLPDMSGVELARRIKENAAHKAIVTVMSSIELIAAEGDIDSGDVDELLPKPLFPSDIVDIINKHLGIKSRSDTGIQESPASNFTGHRVLLAEDVDINREIVIELLKPTGLEIDCADNGAEAVRMFSDAPDEYDIIFMDVQMPVMDGYEATRKIRALDITKSKTIPIIAMTANVFREDVEKCLESGMNSHVGKPLDIGALLVLLNNYLLSGIEQSQ